MTHTIMVVEDDDAIKQYLSDSLLDKGYSVVNAKDGIDAMNQVKKTQPDLILLDLGLPKMRGEAVCTEVKRLYPDIQIIILTAQGTTPEIVNGLNIGADDYVVKPFEVEEILARVQARLRIKHPEGNKLSIADLTMDTITMDVSRGKEKITLTPQEYKLLEYLMNNKGKVLSRTMILNRLWLFSPDIDTRVVDVYIGYLRKKIDENSPKKLIQSIRGFGYSIRE